MSDSNSKKSDNTSEEFPEVPEVPTIPEPPRREFIRPNSNSIKSEPDKGLRAAGLAGGIAFTLVVPPFAGAIIGYFIDEYFKTAPLFLMIFVVLGIVAGFVQMIRLLQKIEDAEKEEKRGK
ncbi:MAG: AtpZ/AtpI family protein [bacterium]